MEINTMTKQRTEETSKDGDWEILDLKGIFIKLVISIIAVIYGLGVALAIISGYLSYGNAFAKSTHIDMEENI
jgi:hypothetical protein